MINRFKPICLEKKNRLYKSTKQKHYKVDVSRGKLKNYIKSDRGFLKGSVLQNNKTLTHGKAEYFCKSANQRKLTNGGEDIVVSLFCKTPLL